MTIALKSTTSAKELIPTAAKVLQTMMAGLVKNQTYGVVDTEKIFEALENKLNAAEIEKKTLEDFRTKLGEIAANEGYNQIVVIIDELDRCRPDFALRLLERVKHLFDVEGISFLLVASSKTLVQMVRHAYGFNEPQAIRYLEKFLTLQNPLPKSLQGTHESRQQAYAEYLAKISNEDDKLSVSQYRIHRLLGSFAKLCDLELRTIEKIYFNFIAVCVQENFPTGLRSFVISLCIIKTVAPEQFRQILESGQCDWEALKKRLKLQDFVFNDNEYPDYSNVYEIIEALFIPFSQLNWINQNRPNKYAKMAATRTFRMDLRGGMVKREKMAKWIAEIINENTSFS